MKIIIDGSIYSSAPSGGIYRYFNELIPRLSAFPDTEVKIFTQKQSAEIPIGNHIEITRDNLPTGSWLPEGSLKRFLRSHKRNLQSYILQKKFSGLKDSVFHSSYYTPSPWSSIAQVVTIHDMISEIFTETYNLAHVRALRESKAKCLKTASRVIAISEQTKKDLQKVYNIPASHIDVIYHGVDFDYFSRVQSPIRQKEILEKHSLNRPYFLFVGGRLHHKNFKGLLKAFAHSKISNDFVLAVAGTPWNEEELSLINSLGVASKLIWMPTLEENELSTVYQKAQALALPSYYEGFGLPLIEAMAAGCPVLASNSGPFPELSQDAALLFNPFNENKIEQAMEAIVKPTTRTELIEAGKKRAKVFSWDLSAQQHFESYSKALKK